jgi:hypothetical protein
MSRSPRTALARLRAEYTGEHPTAARQGVGRNGDLGMDRCTPAQQQLRILIGAHLFNAGQISCLAGSSFVHTITCYTLTMSPRYNELVLIAECPENVLGYLVPRGRGRTPELPGLRLLACDDWQTYRLIHLPTGARMTVTGNRRADLQDLSTQLATTCPDQWLSDWWTAEIPLTSAEQTSLRINPTPPADIAQMIRAVVVRLSARDPAGGWAMGNWFYDPLRRAERPAGANDGHERRLIGAGNY